MIVINFFGPSCSGKSTLAAGVFYRLKSFGLNAEMALEYVKDSVYDGNPYPFKDQIYVFAHQLKRLRQYEGKVYYVVTDAPLLLSHSFAGDKECQAFHDLIDHEWKRYNNVNVFLDWRNVPYTSSGRKSEHDNREKYAKKIKKLLDDRNEKYIVVPSDGDLLGIVALISDEIERVERGVAE